VVNFNCSHRFNHATPPRSQPMPAPARLLPVGRILIFAGLALLAAGIVVTLAERMGIHLGSLPGDIRIQGKRGSFYFPVVTCLIVSAVLSLLAWLLNRR
jgi:hypothetical protein